MIGSQNLTDASIEQAMTVPGMAHFAGSGPPGKTCADCAFKNYPRVARNHAGIATKRPASQGCRKFHELTGAHGPSISGRLHACKYFSARVPHDGHGFKY